MRMKLLYDLAYCAATEELRHVPAAGARDPAEDAAGHAARARDLTRRIAASVS